MKRNIKNFVTAEPQESGRVGYLVLWLLGAPAGFLFILWLLLGNNIFGPG
jgi:hypothetical protein